MFEIIQDPITGSVPDAVWSARWQQLNNYLTRLTEKYEDSASTQVKATVLTLVKSLQSFADKQMNFFIQGFSGDSPGKLETCNQFPAEAALSATLAQIAFDIALFEQIAEQQEYVAHLELTTDDRDDPFVRTLKVGDYLAYEALQAAYTAGLLQEPMPTVLTYFQKAAQVRVIPYAPVVLVGIPYSSIGINQDFLAIPHEVGHYVYHNGRFTDENETEIEPGFPKVVLPNGINLRVKVWFEEIFADVFGALVAGPVIGLDFQDLQKTYKTGDFYQDDDEHPVPLLRPKIYHKVIAEKSAPWAGSLHNSWENYLETRDDALPPEAKDTSDPKGIKRKVKLFDGEIKSVDDMITNDASKVTESSTKPLDQAIRIIREVLLKDLTPSSWPATLGAPASENSTADLYPSFNQFIAGLQLENGPPALTLVGDNFYIGDNATTRKVGETLLNRIEAIREGINTPGNNIKCADWQEVLYVSGWATKGPQCESPGTCG